MEVPHTDGGPRHQRTWQDEAFAAAHGGLWRRTSRSPRRTPEPIASGEEWLEFPRPATAATTDQDVGACTDQSAGCLAIRQSVPGAAQVPQESIEGLLRVDRRPDLEGG